MKNSSPQITLAVETSTIQGSISLLETTNDGSFRVLDEVTWGKDHPHSENLTYFCNSLLEEQKLSLKDIHILAIGTGPGSFTGIRVGINFIKTLAFTLDLPVITQNSLYLLAQQTPPQSTKTIACIINAQKNMVFYSSYNYEKDTLIEVVAPRLVSLKELDTIVEGPTLYLGDGPVIYQKLISKSLKQKLLPAKNSSPFPLSSALGFFHPNTMHQSKTILWSDVKPLYIRPSTAEEMLREGFLKPTQQTNIE